MSDPDFGVLSMARILLKARGLRWPQDLGWPCNRHKNFTVALRTHPGGGVDGQCLPCLRGEARRVMRALRRLGVLR